MALSPGYRFDPTDQELILEYLQRKLLNLPLPWSPIMEVDVYKFHPSELDQWRPQGDEKAYFFTLIKRKYLRGVRPSRLARNGYWKSTTGQKKVRDDRNNLIGKKRRLVFYEKTGEKDKKTNWIMHEYMIEGNQRNAVDPMKFDDWVLCSIYERESSSRIQRQENSVSNNRGSNQLLEREGSNISGNLFDQRAPMMPMPVPTNPMLPQPMMPIPMNITLPQPLMPTPGNPMLPQPMMPMSINLMPPPSRSNGRIM